MRYLHAQKFVLRIFRTQETNIYQFIYEFLQMAEDICVPWSNKSMVQKSNIEYNVQTLS